MKPTDSHLTPEQLAELRGELANELARLERSMKASASAAKPVALDQTAVGRLSRMDAMQNQHLTAELLSREQARHSQLMDAIARMESGAYGRCMTCDGPIAYGRLLVFPEARACAPCSG